MGAATAPRRHGIATCTFQHTAHKGSKAGGAARRVQYITRTGEYASQAAARVAHQGFQTGTQELRDDLVLWEPKNLPAWARDAAHFFDMAEKSTPYTEGQKRPRTAYSEWKFSLPRELSQEEYVKAAQTFLKSTFGESHPYVYAVHCPPAADGGPQPHVHVLWSAATLDNIERSPAQFFKRYDTKHPERGGAKNDLALTHYGAVKAFRVQYTDHMNLALEHAHQMARLHPESLRNRGVTYRTPEKRLTCDDSNAYKFDGEITKNMADVLQHRQDRAPHQVKEQNQNRQYWEQRKAKLGMTRDLDIEDKLEVVTQAREALHTTVPQHAREHQARQRAWEGRWKDEWQETEPGLDESFDVDLAALGFTEEEAEAPVTQTPVVEPHAPSQRIWFGGGKTSLTPQTTRAYHFVLPVELPITARRQVAADICATFFSQHPHVRTLDHGRQVTVTVQEPAGDTSLDRPQEMKADVCALVDDASERAGLTLATHARMEEGWDRAERVTGDMPVRRIVLQAVTDPAKLGVVIPSRLAGLSRQEVVDSIRDTFWAKDTASVREQERNQSFQRRIEGEHQRTGRPLQGPRPPRQHTAAHRHGQSIERQMRALLARMEALDDGAGAGRGVRVRLHDEEEEQRRQRDHGMSW